MKNKPKLTETTLRIYTYMVLKRDWIGVRELQRELKLSSPGLASYHLTKLLEAGFVERSRDGKYRAKPEAGAEILKGFVQLGRLIIPRYAFY
ncbi:MAG TPA: transcriptional regulator, partial [Thermofilum sp.]|nr:transcriptional regulator [Thermofilum sp.]